MNRLLIAYFCVHILVSLLAMPAGWLEQTHSTNPHSAALFISSVCAATFMLFAPISMTLVWQSLVHEGRWMILIVCDVALTLSQFHSLLPLVS
jgi:hypothetical protein